jgi:peroxiredoxin
LFLLVSDFKNKKVVLVAVPGAFTPTCQANHLPGFIQNIEALKAKGVEQVVVIASNDPFVMSAWGKANYTKDDFIVSFFSSCVPLVIFYCLISLFVYNLTLTPHSRHFSFILLVVSSPFFHPAWFFFPGGINELIPGKQPKIFASDSELAFSKAIGWTQGDRTARYAIAVDHGKVVYAAKETERGVDVSGADAVLAKL